MALWGERTFPATQPAPSPRMWGGLGWGTVRISGALSTKPPPPSVIPEFAKANVRDPESSAKTGHPWIPVFACGKTGKTNP